MSASLACQAIFPSLALGTVPPHLVFIYNIKILRGYKYEKEENLFKGYVDDIYRIRLESKNEQLNKIAKLLLNSLYGRFGMKTFVESTKFIKSDKLNEIKEKFNITNIDHVGNDFYILSVIRRHEYAQVHCICFALICNSQYM